MIDEVATDLRLGVVSTPAEPEGAAGREELQRAVRTLLDLHDYLQAARVREREAFAPAARGVRDDEPYI